MLTDNKLISGVTGGHAFKCCVQMMAHIRIPGFRIGKYTTAECCAFGQRRNVFFRKGGVFASADQKGMKDECFYGTVWRG